NWSRGWPATIFIDNFLLRFTKELRGEKQNLTFKPCDEDFPIAIYDPVELTDTPFDILDFTSDVLIDQRLLPSIKLSELNHLFYPGAGEEQRWDFIKSILKRIRGHYLS